MYERFKSHVRSYIVRIQKQQNITWIVSERCLAIILTTFEFENRRHLSNSFTLELDLDAFYYNQNIHFLHVIIQREIHTFNCKVLFLYLKCCPSYVIYCLWFNI